MQARHSVPILLAMLLPQQSHTHSSAAHALPRHSCRCWVCHINIMLEHDGRSYHDVRAGEKDPWEKLDLGRSLQNHACVEEFVVIPGACTTLTGNLPRSTWFNAIKRS